MNTNGIAKHYGELTAEERFRLIMAADSRGDEAEGNRLMSAGQSFHLSFPDHAPYSHAFQELLFLTYIELLEDAAFYLDCNALTETQLRESITSARTRQRPKRTTQKPNDKTPRDDAVEYPAWHRAGRTAYAAGFLFKVKLEGWKLFCQQLNILPFAFWEQIHVSGLDRIKHAVEMANAGAAYPSTEAMTIWVNEVRPTGDPESTEADIMTAERFAASLDTTYQERVRWWGG